MFGLTRKDARYLVPLLVFFALVCTFRAGATGLIDPDEPFYALTAKEMLSRGDWMTPTLFGQPQFEKPIFAYWVYLVLFRWLGVHEWSARLGPSLAGVATLVATAVLARTLFRRSRVVFLSTLILATSGLFLALSRIVLTDMFLCFFVTAALASFARGWKHPQSRGLSWHFFFFWMALGLLTKGPVGALLPMGTVLGYAWMSGERGLVRRLPWATGLLLAAAVAAPWYAWMGWKHGGGFLAHFFWHENVRRFFVAEHRSMDSPFFYPWVIVLGFFPWSALLISMMGSQWSRMNRGVSAVVSGRRFLCAGGFWVFMFFMMAKSKLLSYVFPVFPVLAVLCAEWADRWFGVYRVSGRPFPATIRLTAVMGWIILPAAMSIGLVVYDQRQQFEAHGAVWLAAFLCMAGCLTALAFLWKRRLAAGVAAVAATATALSMLMFGWVLPKVDENISSRMIIEDFRQDGLDPTQGTLLSSKITVRGLSYYANNPNMAVITGNPKKTFYTPHPLPMLSKAGDLDRIDAAHFPVYGIVRPKEMGVLREIAGNGYGLRVLEADDRLMVIRVDRLPRV